MTNLIGKPITGQFILSSLDGKWETKNDGEHEFKHTDVVYFESSAGEGKAKYWTIDIKEAHVFSDMDSAVHMLIQTNRSHSPVKILTLEHQ